MTFVVVAFLEENITHKFLLSCTATLIFGYLWVNIYPFLDIFDKITRLYIVVRLFGNTFDTCLYPFINLSNINLY